MGDGLTSAEIQKGATGVATTATVIGGTAAVLSTTGVTVTVATGSTVVALAGGGTAVMTTTFTAGAANCWNPVGWVCLIIAAVAALVVLGTIIYQNWDAISEFFSGLWDSFWNWFKATIVYDAIVNTAVPWVTSTIDKAWAFATGVAISVATTMTKPKISWKDMDIATLIILSTLAGLLPDFNVYELYVNKTKVGQFINYIRKKKGEPDKSHPIKLKRWDTYKYGITRFHTVEGRYLAFSWIPKERAILKQLLSYQLKSRWHLWHVFYPVARYKENELISAYAASHGGEFPPGNTGLY
jgi:hypothetical protein